MPNETTVPKYLVSRALKWYDRQITRLKKKHGDQWLDHREWIEDYLNAELVELVDKEVVNHGI
ncbi:MAG TPA: hypothetical protein PLL01_09135 [Rhodoferax sp.]|jgi:hypothetical protein|nr:hypothetical protein [Rhodoferax sp.]